MALRDWNNDGKNDMMDDFIEYSMYNTMIGDDGGTETSNYHSSGSTFEGILVAILSLAAAFVTEAGICVALDINVDNIPGFVIVIVTLVLEVAYGLLITYLTQR